jgi:hypothetical protein
LPPTQRREPLRSRVAASATSTDRSFKKNPEFDWGIHGRFSHYLMGE